MRATFDQKEEDAKQFLFQMQERADKDRARKLKPKTKKAAPVKPGDGNLMDKDIELSQMSEWTEEGRDTKTGGGPNRKYKSSINPVSVKKLEDQERVLNTKMDREGLLQELKEYKVFSL